MNRYQKIHNFHGARATGVGSSDIPTLAGFSRQWGQTPYTLWRQKTGIDGPSEAGERADWGHRLEGLVLARFIEGHFNTDTAMEFLRYKNRGMSIGQFLTETECRMPSRPYVLAHADLIIDDFDTPAGRQSVIVEAKTTGLMSAKRDDDPDEGYSKTDFSQEGIPAKVFLQVQWQLLAYDVKFAYVAVLIDGGEYREYGPIVADPRTQEKCLALAERFWKCVETKTEPKPETWGDIGLMFPNPKDNTAMIGGEDELKTRAMISKYHRHKAFIKKLEERTDEITTALGILIGDNKTLVSAEGVKLASSWSVEKENASVSALKEKEPEIYTRLKEAGIITASSWRTLRPAKIKGAV